jgi:cell division protein FtsZ
MTLNISVPTSTQELRPKITVVGVGGAGGNAVNNMISSDLEGVDFLVANTDGQSLAKSLAERKIQLGRNQTQGLGAGSRPEVGRTAAEESLDDIMAELADSHMVFITAGMGGGTGTGAAPIIAKAARERGILTVGVVTKPFDFEGQKRMTQANNGIEELQAYVDTLIIVPNQNLFRLANEKTTFADAFAMADEVLHKGVCGVTDLMVKPGNINLDFADIRTVMSEMGKAMMGTGEATGDNRAANAAEAAINNPLLDETTMKGAQAVLINITGGNDMTLFEVDEAANHIRREVDTEATIIFGSALDDKMEGMMRVSVVATGMEALERDPLETPPLEREHYPPNTAAPIHHHPEAQPDFMSSGFTHTDNANTDDDAPFHLTNAVDEIAEAPETEAEDEASADQPFIMRPVVEIPEEAQKAENREGSKSLIGHLSRIFTSKTEEKPDQVPDTSAGDTNAGDTRIEAKIEPGFASGINPPEQTSSQPVSAGRVDHVDGIPSDAPTPKVLDEASSDGDTPPDLPQPTESGPTESGPTESGPTESGPTESGLAVLKPTAQPQLEITKVGEDADLDIPAFLRRQAN